MTRPKTQRIVLECDEYKLNQSKEKMDRIFNQKRKTTMEPLNFVGEKE